MTRLASFSRLFSLSGLSLFVGSALFVVVGCLATRSSFGQSDKGSAPKPTKLDTSRGDAMIRAYFIAEGKRLTNQPIRRIKSLEAWQDKRAELHKQMLEMLGLQPLPKKTDLKPVITGKVEHEKFIVEKLHFQSRPGLYVTGNLYIPKGLKEGERLPTILYVCGHGRVKKGDISYGNKSNYQHHGAWFAQNGYVCLTIDTLQLGEIEGKHHGTYRFGDWWWNARGYTPAGVEAWNCVRALDYLETRPEVDKERFGVTGRSGGGAYSWWISAIDERIKCAVPVAGITDLRNYVYDAGPGRYEDGCVEGHCDCMFFVNTHRWDYATVAALVAPRPLLISNTDKDSIFPLDGVVRLHAQVKKIYDLHDAGKQLGLHITEGPHKDTQELRVHAFRWFNRHLKKDDSLLTQPAEKLFEPEQLRVFPTDEGWQPKNQKNTQISESFTRKPRDLKPPTDRDAFDRQAKRWMKNLTSKSFAGWPNERTAGDLNVKPAFDETKNGIRFRGWDFTSQGVIRLRLYALHDAALKEPDLVVLNTVDDAGWDKFARQMRVDFDDQMKGDTHTHPSKPEYDVTRRILLQHKSVMAYIAPRGIGPTAWDQSKFKQTQHRRRFMLLGQTLDGMRVWDIRRAIQALRTVDDLKNLQLWLNSEEGTMSGNTLYASLFEDNIYRVDLWHLPASHRHGPIYLNVMRFMDTPQAVVQAATRARVRVYLQAFRGWEYAVETARNLKLDEKQLKLEPLTADPNPTPVDPPSKGSRE